MEKLQILMTFGGQMKPIHDRVIVELDKPDEMIGSLYIPPTDQERSRIGTVVAVGPGWTNEKGRFVKPSLKVGDRVLHNYPHGVLYEENGKEYVVAREEYLLGRIE